MATDGVRLGVDFGTTNTVAVLRRPGAPARPLLFDGSPLLPSAVYAGADGGIAVGRAAIHAARAEPERFEPHPKRSIDHGSVLLGADLEVPVERLIEAVLRRVAEEAARAAGGPVVGPVLTYPASWGETRRATFEAAAATVFAAATFVSEPVAAASHFAATAGAAVPVDGCVLVYDFGAGTFDATVLRRTDDGFRVLTAEGLPDAGGIDIDAALVAFLGATYSGRDAAAWCRLGQPSTDADRRMAQSLWHDVRTAKELLSQVPSTLVHVPLFDDAVPFGREQLEQLARPILDRTVDACRAALRTAGVPGADLAGLYLVGGSSRMPLAATLLHRAFGVAPTLADQPELAVAEGSLGPEPLSTMDSPGPPSNDETRPDGVRPPPLVGPAPVADGWRRRVREPATMAAAAVLAVAILLVTVLAVRSGSDRRPGDTVGSPLGIAASASPSASPSPSSLIDPCLIGVWRETANVVDFTFNGVLVPMRASGAIARYWPDGRSLDDYGAGNVSAGTAGGRRYEVVISGTMAAYVSTSNGKMFFRDLVATGTIVGRVNGRESWREPLRSATGDTSYDCRGDVLTVSVVDRNITLARASSDPDAVV